MRPPTQSASEGLYQPSAKLERHTNPKRQRGSLSTIRQVEQDTNPKRQRGSLSTVRQVKRDTNPKRQRGSLSTIRRVERTTNPKRQRGSLSTTRQVERATNPKRQRGSLSTTRRVEQRPPTRKRQRGSPTIRVEPEHPQPGGDFAAVLAGGSCGSGQMSGTLAGARVGVRMARKQCRPSLAWGWGAMARKQCRPSLALRVGVRIASEGMPTLAGASGWGDRRPPVSVEAQRTARVSLTMIVKNQRENLPSCLASVEGIFDEIIIVDTGSTDRTKEIAREFGAKVFDFEWVDSFAAAMNEALSHATGDYAFWLDADDEVEPAERVRLLTLLAGLKRPSTGGMASAMLPVMPPLTRPAGDLSPGRGENQRASHGTVSSTGEVAAASPALRATSPTREERRSPATMAAPSPALRAISPAGRGDNRGRHVRWLGAGHGSPDPAHTERPQVSSPTAPALGAGLSTPPAERPQVTLPGIGRRALDDGSAYVVSCTCTPSPDAKKRRPLSITSGSFRFGRASRPSSGCPRLRFGLG